MNAQPIGNRTEPIQIEQRRPQRSSRVFRRLIFLAVVAGIAIFIINTFFLTGDDVKQQAGNPPNQTVVATTSSQHSSQAKKPTAVPPGNSGENTTNRVNAPQQPASDQTNARVVVVTGPGKGAFLRDSPAWGDHQNVVVPEGGVLEILKSDIFADGRDWYYVRVVETKAEGYMPVELTTPLSDAENGQPTIAPRT